MYIGIIVPYFTPYVRGNEYGLAQGLTMLGHKVTIIAANAKAPRERGLDVSAESRKRQDFDIQYFDTLIDAGDNPIIRGKLDVSDFDVLMLQEDYPLICHKAYSAARERGIPTILSSERTYYPDNIMKRYALKLMDATSNRKLRNGVDVLTAHCTAAREFMMRELHVERDIKVIHVGVDSTLFRPTQPGWKYMEEGDFNILTTARLHKYKGLGYLIQAMRIVREDIRNARLYILGKGAEEKNLKALTHRLDMDSCVTFLPGTVPNHEMPALYAECDVYAQSSIIEPYGIAVLEAMACGKPVVGTDVGGMRDTISNEAGYRALPADSGELASYIKLLYDENTRKIIGERARRRAVEEFDWRIISKKYAGVINAIK